MGRRYATERPIQLVMLHAPDHQAALKTFVERALDASTEDDVRFHLRQALQLMAD